MAYTNLWANFLSPDAQAWKPAKLAPIGKQPSAGTGVTVGRTDWAAK